MQEVGLDNHNPVKTSNKQARGNSSDFFVRELSLIMTGRGWKRSCRGLKFFPANLLGSETIGKHLVGVSN